MFKKEIKGVPRIHLRLPNANVVLNGVFDTTVSKDALEKELFKNQLIGLFSPKILDVMMLNYSGQRDDMLAKKLLKIAGMYKLNSTFTIANLGILEIAENLEKLKVKTLFGPMAVSNAMEKYIGVLTINNELHFPICFNENIW